ncbi:MAG: alpha/beta fold hydrolase [Candidatus Komeilibacteria bacterium]
MIEEKEVNNQGVKIYYKVKAGKPILLFLHGTGCNMTIFDKYKEHYNKLGYGWISIDLRGYGMSSEVFDKQSYVLNKFVEDIELIIQTEKVRNFSIIAYSMGGMIAHVLAGKYPDMVESLVLISGSYNFRKTFEVDIYRKIFLRFIRPIYLKLFNFVIYITLLFRNNSSVSYPIFSDEKWLSIKDVRMDFYLRMILGPSRVKANNICSREVLKWDTSQHIRLITAPTLLIQGNNDMLLPIQTVYELHTMIKSSLEPVVVEGGEHGVVFKKVDTILNEMDKFFNKIYLTNN